MGGWVENETDRVSVKRAGAGVEGSHVNGMALFHPHLNFSMKKGRLRKKASSTYWVTLIALTLSLVDMRPCVLLKTTELQVYNGLGNIPLS